MVKVRAPQPAIGGEPVVELSQRLGSDAVETTLRVRARLDQASLLQDPQVLRDGRLAEAEPIYKLSHRLLPVPEDAQNCLPVRLA